MSEKFYTIFFLNLRWMGLDARTKEARELRKKTKMIWANMTDEDVKTYARESVRCGFGSEYPIALASAYRTRARAQKRS